MCTPKTLNHAFRDVPVEKLAVFAANTVWPARNMVGEELVIVVRPEEGASADAREVVGQLAVQNRQLADHKRTAGVVVWEAPFPRTASMKLKRGELVAQLHAATTREDMVRFLGSGREGTL